MGHLKVKGQNLNILIFLPISINIIKIISVKIIKLFILVRPEYSPSDILHRKVILHCFNGTLNSHLATNIGQSSNFDLVFLINISRSE